MIRIQNVSKTFNQKDIAFHALDDVSLTIKQGSIHGIIGPSGAGKSTLVRVINQLEETDKGTIDVFEYKDIKKLNKESTRMLRKRIGMIFQNFNLLERKTVIENILLPIRLNHKPTSDDLIKVNELIETVGLTKHINSYPSELSGGQKQRVGIARALINNPEILLCDEPTSALDTTTIKSLLALLKNLRKIYGLTIIVVTHDMNVIKDICDFVTVMDHGKIMESNDLDSIIFQPKSKVTKALLDTVGYNYDELINKYSSYKNLLLLKFNNRSKQESVISELSIKFGVKINILFANITPSGTGIMLTSTSEVTYETLQLIKNELLLKNVEVAYV